MNRERSSSDQTVSPAKLAIIAALALVLVLVLAFQFGGQGGEPPVARNKRTPGNSASTAETSNSNANPATSSNRIRWPDIQRDEVASFNPFEIPEAIRDKPVANDVPSQTSQSVQTAQVGESPHAEPAVATAANGAAKGDEEQAGIRAQERKSRIKRIEATAVALRQQGVAVVMTTSSGAVARVGKQEVRVGDVINGVVRVVEITPQGIVIEEATEELPEQKAN